MNNRNKSQNIRIKTKMNNKTANVIPSEHSDEGSFYKSLTNEYCNAVNGKN
jgi:hypothetical protein